MPVRFVIIGGGPAGNTAATVAASLGAEVTLIERDVVGGAAHLWDCIPSKAMVATGNELAELARGQHDGPRSAGPSRRRRAARAHRRHGGDAARVGVTSLLESQGVRLIRGTGRLTGAYTVAADTDDGTEEIEADAILLVDRVAARACPTGPRSTASASSRPARPTRRPRSPIISS